MLPNDDEPNRHAGLVLMGLAWYIWRSVKALLWLAALVALYLIWRAF